MATLSQLEWAVLECFHTLYTDLGFPPPGQVFVLRRRNTGGGRYVHLTADQTVDAPDGYLDMGGAFIEMEGLPYGLMAVVAIEGGRLDQLELAVYGDDGWDGIEREWSLTTPRQ